MAFAKCLFFFFSLPFTKIHVLLKTKQQGKKKKRRAFKQANIYTYKRKKEMLSDFYKSRNKQ